jgi:hypothetical protein
MTRDGDPAGPRSAQVVRTRDIAGDIACDITVPRDHRLREDGAVDVAVTVVSPERARSWTADVRAYEAVGFGLGVGAGHARVEFEQAGIPYPSARERVDRLAATVDVVTRLLDGETVDQLRRLRDDAGIETAAVFDRDAAAIAPFLGMLDE